jgi:hypothetical protein
MLWNSSRLPHRAPVGPPSARRTCHRSRPQPDPDWSGPEACDRGTLRKRRLSSLLPCQLSIGGSVDGTLSPVRFRPSTCTRSHNCSDDAYNSALLTSHPKLPITVSVRSDKASLAAALRLAVGGRARPPYGTLGDRRQGRAETRRNRTKIPAGSWTLPSLLYGLTTAEGPHRRRTQGSWGGGAGASGVPAAGRWRIAGTVRVPRVTRNCRTPASQRAGCVPSPAASGPAVAWPMG